MYPTKDILSTAPPETILLAAAANAELKTNDLVNNYQNQHTNLGVFENQNLRIE